MAVRRGMIADTQPFAVARQPSFRASRPVQPASLFDLFGGADGQPISISVDAAIWITRQVQVACDTKLRVQRPFMVLADLRQSTGSRVMLFSDARLRVRGSMHVQADVRLRIGRRVTRLADLSQCIGVGVSFPADAAFTIYRVVLHEDHLILT